MKEYEASYLAGIIDGEGTITLTKMHQKENRRPIISNASTDKELLEYIHSLTGGVICNKKNYSPGIHRDSYTLTIKRKEDVFSLLQSIAPYLRVKNKKDRAIHLLEHYDRVTPRNGKYSLEMREQKIAFEKQFFSL
ncbi:LAGLIDADG family homing endonuclease [Evansella sp. AB-rgal1]|uniref:LAGLIDADG family homing endonuclease n=1 Tax=Evansella sp. AB-rgal1 TaxID=3242696 RepID=UPI00359D6E3E